MFSSLTNQKKIDEIIGHNLLQSKRLASEKLSFEELYVYEITKLPLLRTLESKGLNGLHFFAQGKRGIIYRGILERSKLIKTHFSKREELVVAVKTTRKESQAINRINNEIRWLKILNKKNIGPRLLFYGEDYFVYQFVEGKFILDWLKKGSKDQIRQVLINILDQCATLDQLKVTPSLYDFDLIMKKSFHPNILF